MLIFSGLFNRNKDKPKDEPKTEDKPKSLETPPVADASETVPVPPPVDQTPPVAQETPTPADSLAPKETEAQTLSAPPAAPTISPTAQTAPTAPAASGPSPTETPPTTRQAPSPQNAPTPPTPETTEKSSNWFSRLTEGLSKSSTKLSDGVSSIFTKRKLDDDTLEDLNDLLITADLGVAAATRITEGLAEEKFDKEISDQEVKSALAAEVAKTLTPFEKPLTIDNAKRPHIILMIGVNGAGKTTTIGKLAEKLRAAGKSVMLAAGDTFRAAAIEQLTVWGDRTGAPVISRTVGADAAGLAYDAVEEARKENTDVLIVDTAGRLQNKSALMEELAKIVRTLKKLDATAPHDVLLVLDATVGQNALSQTEAFKDVAGVTGIVMTKLDGTARGGVLVALADKFDLPVHYIGVGESVDDLQPFNAEAFAKALAGSE